MDRIWAQRDSQDTALNIDPDLTRDLEELSHHPQAPESGAARDVASHLLARAGIRLWTNGANKVS
jgi:hypothetical protein